MTVVIILQNRNAAAQLFHRLRFHQPTDDNINYSISRSIDNTASDTPMLTQNVNLPLGMFPIVIFTD